MKKLLYIVFALAMLNSCGPRLYSTYSAGKDNAAFVIVITSSSVKYENVSVVIDGQSFPVKKVYKQKMIRKAIPIETTPGKHHIMVVADGKTLRDENVIIGLQETKKIVLP